MRRVFLIFAASALLFGAGWQACRYLDPHYMRPGLYDIQMRPDGSTWVQLRGPQP